ncbi:hypothetical protein ACFQZQ_14630 [Lysobacter koreensis]|uniref:Uncharacterized protein n=1 Tax=Lysobacter koreensis TaxID=266122 RepID=A0ABW2YPY9_9GAMM
MSARIGAGRRKPPAAAEPSATIPAPAPATPAPANAAKGKRAPGQEDAPLQAWRGFGTEPFWEARVDGDTLVFTTPDNQPGTTMKGRRVPSLVGYVFIGTHDGREFHLGLTPGECSDGMSDNRYDFTATFTLGTTTYKGCGEAAK